VQPMQRLGFVSRRKRRHPRTRRARAGAHGRDAHGRGRGPPDRHVRGSRTPPQTRCG
jgi:hypothetical protein